MVGWCILTCYGEDSRLNHQQALDLRNYVDGAFLDFTGGGVRDQLCG
jgi:hypothetical protein